jgi:hypothetical protein
MFDLLKNLSADKIFTPTGQPLSEAFGIRPDATIAEIAKPDLKFADIAVPFRPGLDVSIRPGLIDPGRIDPGDVRKPPVDPTTPALSWPSVGIPADVRPGDLIQAAAWNALLAWVRALYANAGKAAPAQPAAPTTRSPRSSRFRCQRFRTSRSRWSGRRSRRCSATPRS